MEIKGVSCVYVNKCIRENMMVLENISRAGEEKLQDIREVKGTNVRMICNLVNI